MKKCLFLPSLLLFLAASAAHAQNTHQATAVTPPPPGTLNATASLHWDDGSPVAGSVAVSQIVGTSRNVLGTFPINSRGVVSGTIKIDMTQSDPLTFQIVLVAPGGASVGGPVTFQVIKAMFPSSSTGVKARIVLAKATLTIKTFDIGLVP